MVGQYVGKYDKYDANTVQIRKIECKYGENTVKQYDEKSLFAVLANLVSRYDSPP